MGFAVTEFSHRLETYCARILAHEPMAIYRFGDGERLLMLGQAVGEYTQAARVDRWTAPSGVTRLGRDLYTVLTSGQGAHAHFGISCPCCDEVSYAFYAGAVDRSPTFSANLFINANYPRWRTFLEQLKDRNVAVILNEHANTRDLPFVPSCKIFVPDDCVNRYEQEHERYTGYARSMARELDRAIVLVAAGPMSEPLIHFMWNENPNNTYVDVGSSLDEMTYGRRTRPYADPESEYARKTCSLPERAASEIRSVSVIINTAAMGLKARSVLSSSGIPHGQRALLLRGQVLPRLLRDPAVDEVLVVGEYEPAEGYQYIESPSVAFDATDALQQRASGAAASRGDVMVFQHDDHTIDESFFEILRTTYARDSRWDVLVPARWTMDSAGPRQLNNGSAEGYVGGHVCVMRRSIVDKAPWSAVGKVPTWDLAHTSMLRACGARIRWVEDLKVWDLEGRAPGYGW